MSVNTHRLLGLAAWVSFSVFVYVSAPSTARGMHLFASMIAWSLVALAFGVSWVAARSWLERRMPLDNTHALRRFKLGQIGVWMGTVVAFAWVGVVTAALDEAAWMGIFTLLCAPIWFGVRNMLEPRSARPTA
jgi:hypothetical protein